MWRSRKLIISVVLAAVILFGSLGGIALAQDDEDVQPGTSFLERLADKLGITEQELSDKIAEVRAELPAREPMVWAGRQWTAGCFGNIEEILGIEIDEEALKEALVDARARIQAGEDRDEVIAEVFANFGIDLEQLKTQCAELREQKMAERQEGRMFGPRAWFKGANAFRGMGGMRGFGGQCAPVE